MAELLCYEGQNFFEFDELKILDLTLAALEEAIEEAGNTRRGRALKRRAEKIRGAIRSRGSQSRSRDPQVTRKGT